MSENFQNPPFLGTSKPLQRSGPGVSNAATRTGSICHFSRGSAPMDSTAWPLPPTCRKPQSRLGKRMLESVQVVHALGRKADKATDLSSSWALGNSRNPKGPHPPPPIKRRLDTLHEGQGPKKTQVKCPKADGRAEKECSSPSEVELPPPGKVKVVPLVFPTLDRPQVRPVPRRSRSLESHQPAVTCPARPSSNSIQPPAVHSSQPMPASMTGPTRPSQPISNKPAQPGLTNPCWANVSQSAASRPVPYKTSSYMSHHQKPIHTAVTNSWPYPSIKICIYSRILPCNEFHGGKQMFMGQ
ncbi:uncharacterized protein C2orf78-like [Molossus nigricans]